MGFRSSSVSRDKYYKGQHRFEHWYRDNSVYFITARCKDHTHAFASDAAKDVFWSKFEQYTSEYGFVPWITSLLDNHYHTVGYLKIGKHLGPMMRKFHGSIAKLTNDLLENPLKPFWFEHGKQGYFDGCLRDEVQGRRTYEYIQRQSVRHGVAKDSSDYPHTRINVEMTRALQRATDLKAWMTDVPYKRYQRPNNMN